MNEIYFRLTKMVRCSTDAATPSVLCCVVCSSVCGSVQQQEGLREHEKMNHPGIPAYHR